MGNRKVLFLATSRKTRGGIAAVLNTYTRLSFWNEYHVRWIGTHIDRSQCQKWLFAVKALLSYICCIGFYDLVHIHVGELPSIKRKFIFFKIAKLCQKRIVIHLHIGNQLDGYRDNKLCRELLEGADAIIVLSQSIRTKISAYFGVGEKVHVIYNPCSIVSNVHYSDQHKYILFAGTLNQNKGYAVLIKAFAKIAIQFPDWRLVLAGNGELEQAQQLVKDLGIEHQVVFAGWVTDSKKEQLFREASVFCLSSYAEGFPMAVLDAWSYGIPVVSTPVGGLPDVLRDNENALLFQPGDVDMLAEKFIQVLSDATCRKRLSSASLALSKGLFSIQTINSQIEALYEICLTTN